VQPFLLAILHRLRELLPAQAAASQELREVAHNGPLHLAADERRCSGLVVEDVVAVLLHTSVALLDVSLQVLLAHKGTFVWCTEEAIHGRQRTLLAIESSQRRKVWKLSVLVHQSR